MLTRFFSLRDNDTTIDSDINVSVVWGSQIMICLQYCSAHMFTHCSLSLTSVFFQLYKCYKLLNRDDALNNQFPCVFDIFLCTMMPWYCG